MNIRNEKTKDKSKKIIRSLEEKSINRKVPKDFTQRSQRAYLY
jgi:hypothetical protein